MVHDVILVFTAAQIVVYGIAAYFSYAIYRFNRLVKLWLSITAAFVIMTALELAALLVEIGMMSAFTGVVYVLDLVLLPFLVSILIVCALSGMKRNFESFEVVERRATEKVSEFNKARAKNKSK